MKKNKNTRLTQAQRQVLLQLIEKTSLYGVIVELENYCYQTQKDEPQKAWLVTAFRSIIHTMGHKSQE